MDATIADPLIGALLDDRYRVGGLVARGGMATVYHAVDERLERTVAIKIIHASHATDRLFTERFEREAKMIARLTNPNIVSVYDEGRHKGLPYLVMEFVRGNTLRDVLNERRRLPVAEALNVMIEIVSGLAAAHRAGVVHRDIKPENVLISEDGQIKVADFGLARAVEASGEERAGNGQLLATVAYVAPELVSDGHADPRADVYSAGIVLFELLTGRVPYEGTKAVEVAWQHVERDVPPPSKFVPSTPHAFDELVARATRRDAGARPTDAGALLAELLAAREDRTSRPLVRGASTVSSSSFLVPHTQLITVDRHVGRAHTRRRPPVYTIAGLVLLVLFTLAGGWWFGAGRYVETPGLLTLTQAEAQMQAAQAGFAVKSAEGFSETSPVGTVIAQTPKPKASIVRGGTIGLTISKGPERHTVPPEVVGMDAARALKVLSSLTFKTSRFDKYSTTVESGKVISVDPPTGTVLPPGAAISVTVSKRPPPITIPNVSGKKVDDVTRELEKLGLDVRVVRQESTSAPKDRVISQDPPHGTGVERRAPITLVVSSGPPLVTVPRVGGMSYEEAKKALESAGLVAAKSFDWPGGRNTVYTQVPAANTQTPKGSTVSLWLY
ncbi:MAG: Stk1 family PASTA domain-containing Ser/Thr kinase [Longispora sp.]|nr:Stk1 family PASTA domain-containing Ser/Thr kinase [Longispora sp. (in: high G+C Gram-positive bacteria)]